MTPADASLPRLSSAKDRAGSGIGAITVVGVGGLGAAAALELAVRGVEALALVDPDRVELSNLHRQILFDGDDLGKPKAEVAAAKLARLRPAPRVSATVAAVRSANAEAILAGSSVVVDATDDAATKFLLNDACVRLRLPLVHAGATGLRGQLLTIAPGRGPCLRCLFPEGPDESETATCRDGGVLGPLPAWVGALEADHALRLLAGAPVAGRLTTIDARTLRVRSIAVSRSPACLVCSDAAMIGAAHGARLASPGLLAKEMS